ncbi:DUF4362 domain-containing protein [Paenibacillus sp. HW567]|uniref:DUF4362 domain-containing protein n=1 Tax=Paenibacillus sp. HW567 TaxID=1034769 RepID=UPI0003815C40|nr:DUF4362 domain-containing protein [Paenibacillus sp. HW567]
MNKSNRILLLINILLVVLLFFLLVNTHKEKVKNTYVSSNLPILLNFDNNDLKKIDHFIDNFNHRKSDYLMLIPRPIDSGFVINDVYTDGKTITWSIDNSRDALSTAKTTNYYCQKIEKVETNEFYNILLSNCVDFDPDEKLKILNIEKKD